MLQPLMAKHSCGINKNLLLSPSPHRVSKYEFLSSYVRRKYLPIALGLNIIKYILNNLHACLFIIMKIIAKIIV